MNIKEILGYLKAYDGPALKLMEVCGTHTSEIFKSGIRSLISSKIKLISGPGCPVCVTPAAYIDRCISYACKENHILLSFGDMMKVPGEKESLSEVKGRGANVALMYSPAEAVIYAKNHPDKVVVVAASGFETTAPAYALALLEAKEAGIGNLKFVTALKTVTPALAWICENEKEIDGFLCPGHVSVIIGSKPYEELCRTYEKPFVIAGFEPEHILAGIYDLVKQIVENRPRQVHNLYTNVVKPGGNPKALALLAECYEAGNAVWRGLGAIENSGLYLSKAYEEYDGGSRGLDRDKVLPRQCRCGDVIVGRINPDECPMFATACEPMHPYGPCMVSAEGACGIWYRNREAIEK